MSDITERYGRDLDLNLLRVFAVVAEAGSITRAAARLYVTQPAVSAAMRRLTEFVGAALFTRQGRGVVLTARGSELLSATRSYLEPLVAAALATPLFDPKQSAASVRVGLVDGAEPVLVPLLYRALASAAPRVQLILVPVQFRTVEDSLLTKKVDVAVCVADELPRSICRKILVPAKLVCLYDSRFRKLPKKPSERDFFACEHVAVSYAGDARGVIEDATGKTRKVRVSVPSFSYVADVLEGTALVATVPAPLAHHVARTRPHLKSAPLPVALDLPQLELLWPRNSDDDPLSRFLRDLLERVVQEELAQK
jgi:LysR family transcriptional activator of mexEF-oprN operon